VPTFHEIVGKFSEDGSATLLGRVTARDGTGTQMASGRNLLKQADLSSISISIFDLSSDTPTTAVSGPTVLTISSVIFDTLQTTWDVDSIGFNFKTDIASTVFSTGDHVYRAIVKWTTTGSTVAWGRWTGPAIGVQTS
jgi:hypothetical protein